MTEGKNEHTVRFRNKFCDKKTPFFVGMLLNPTFFKTRVSVPTRVLRWITRVILGSFGPYTQQDLILTIVVVGKYKQNIICPLSVFYLGNQHPLNQTLK